MEVRGGGGHRADTEQADHSALWKLELEACAGAEGARRGREGNVVPALIRPNGWWKVARSTAAPRKRAQGDATPLAWTERMEARRERR